MSAFIRTLYLGRDRQRIPRVALAVCFAALAGAALILVSGHDPLSAYAEIVRGSLSPAALPDTLNWATPLLGMTLAVAVPLRGGMVNLGGDGQIVIGGLIGALAPLFLPAPGALGAAAGLILAGFGGGLYAAFAAWGEVRHGVPMLISESPTELPCGRCDVLPRSVSPSRRFDRTAANPHGPAERAPLRPLRAAERR